MARRHDVSVEVLGPWSPASSRMFWEGFALPYRERRLDAEVEYRYGRTLAEVWPAWRPFRAWAAAHLRTLREWPAHEIGGVTGLPEQFLFAAAVRVGGRHRCVSATGGRSTRAAEL